MGVLPLQFREGEGATALGLKGDEVFNIRGIGEDLSPGRSLTVTARSASGQSKTFSALARLDSPVEVQYYRNGGILHTVLRALLKGA